MPVTQDNRPPKQSSRPASAKDTYSILDTGEVVPIAVERQGTGHGARLHMWVWSDEDRDWVEPDRQIQQQLRAGLDRYETLLRRDPKRAAQLRQRADNAVSGSPNPETAEQIPEEVVKAAIPDADKATGEQPRVDA